MALSVTITTKDESENIVKCIKSVDFSDEIVVVDDCSTDETVEKARSLGAKVIIRDSKGSFHENKNIAIKEANGEWILSLDADELVSAELANSIQSVLCRPLCDGYFVDRHNYFLGRWIKGCGWYPDHILRLFRKGQAWWPMEIHDTPKLEGEGGPGMLKGPLIHHSYNSFEQYFDKFNRYTSRLAEEYTQHGVNMKGSIIPINVVFRPLYWFLKKYVFLRGYRDGLLGFFISLSSALTISVSHLKLWHNQNVEDIQGKYFDT